MHIDPFAPGDSPQHPANFGTFQEAPPVAEDPAVVKYLELLALYGTAEEQAASATAESEDNELPPFEELEARAEDAAVYRLRLDMFGTEEEKARTDWTFWQLHERFDFGSAPAASAVKAEWVKYAERVAAVRGESIPRNADGEPGTVKELQEYASHAFDLEDEFAAQQDED
jgi:hypothetical protein